MYEEAIEKVYAAKLEKGKAYVNVFGGEAPKEMKEEAKEKQQAAEKV